MDCFFRLNLKPFSVNNYYYKDKRHKTAEARAWEDQVRLELNEVKELSDIAQEWLLYGGHFILDIHCFYPSHIYYTQTGEISGRTFDCSNVEKPLQDLIFKQMGLNDKLVKRLVSEKSPGSYHYIEVKLTLVKETK